MCDCGAAVSVTLLPARNLPCAQPLEAFGCALADAPPKPTLSVSSRHSLKLAVSTAAALGSTKAKSASLLLTAPLQPVKTQPAAAVALSATVALAR